MGETVPLVQMLAKLPVGSLLDHRRYGTVLPIMSI